MNEARALLETVEKNEKLMLRISCLQAALTFYAAESTWKASFWKPAPCLLDRGDIARKALRDDFTE